MSLQANITTADGAYVDGVEAAYRTGTYSGFKGCPCCPFPPSSVLAQAWGDGFDAGTEDLISQRRFEAGTPPTE